MTTEAHPVPDPEAVFAAKSEAAYKAYGGKKKPWAYLSSEERSNWMRVVIAVDAATPKAVTPPKQDAAPVAVEAPDIDALMLKLSAETHKAVDDAIVALHRLDGGYPITAQWWGIISMALYKASLIGAAPVGGQHWFILFARAAIAEHLKASAAACREAYENTYHKVRAEVGYDVWEKIWNLALGTPPIQAQDAAPVAADFRMRELLSFCVMLQHSGKAHDLHHHDAEVIEVQCATLLELLAAHGFSMPDEDHASRVPVAAGVVGNELGNLIACFDAAFAEGLTEALAETTDERLKDLVERRLIYGYWEAIGPSPAAARGAGGSVPAIRDAAIEECAAFLDRDASRVPVAAVSSIHQHWHHKSNPFDLYTVLAVGKLQTAEPANDMSEVVIYTGPTGTWVRPKAEFLDGRFHEAPAPGAGGSVPASREQSYAVQEAHRIADCESYFKARPQIDSIDRRRVFEAGFDRGYTAQGDSAHLAVAGAKGLHHDSPKVSEMLESGKGGFFDEQKYPELAIPPIQAQDAAPVAGHSDLIDALAQCRDAFPIPERGHPLEVAWADAINDPLNVPAYVKLAAAPVGVQPTPSAVDAVDARRYREFRLGKPLVVKCKGLTIHLGASPDYVHNFGEALDVALDAAILAATPTEGVVL